MNYKRDLLRDPGAFSRLSFSHVYSIIAFHALHTYTIILDNKDTYNDHRLDAGLWADWPVVVVVMKGHCGDPGPRGAAAGPSAFTGPPWLRCDWVWSINKRRDEVSGSIDSSRLPESLRLLLEEMQLQVWLGNTAATSALISPIDMTLISLK